MREVLKLPLRLSQPHEEEIESILAGYNKDKLTELTQELETWKKKVR